MNLLPCQASELSNGQPQFWDFFNQDQKKILTQGEVLRKTDEALLKNSSLLRHQ